ncbi:hypothetical protein GIB67_038704, partial [Kingdonia uniflora]
KKRDYANDPESKKQLDLLLDKTEKWYRYILWKNYQIELELNDKEAGIFINPQDLPSPLDDEALLKFLKYDVNRAAENTGGLLLVIVDLVNNCSRVRFHYQFIYFVVDGHSHALVNGLHLIHNNVDCPTSASSSTKSFSITVPNNITKATKVVGIFISIVTEDTVRDSETASSNKLILGRKANLAKLPNHEPLSRYHHKLASDNVGPWFRVSSGSQLVISGGHGVHSLRIILRTSFDTFVASVLMVGGSYTRNASPWLRPRTFRGQLENYSWNQTAQDVFVTAPLSPVSGTDPKYFMVDTTDNIFNLGFPNEPPIIIGKLFDAVVGIQIIFNGVNRVVESVTVRMAKRDHVDWTYLVNDAPVASTKTKATWDAVVHPVGVTPEDGLEKLKSQFNTLPMYFGVGPGGCSGKLLDFPGGMRVFVGIPRF